MENKKCSKCLYTKCVEDFYKNRKGYRSICKICYKDENSKYRSENRESIKIQKNIHRNINKESILEKEKEKRRLLTSEEKANIKEYQKLYLEKNKETIKEKKRIYYLNNREILLNKSKEYQVSNNEKIKEYRKNVYNKKRNINRRIRRGNDIIFLLECNIRNLIYDAFKRNGYKKESRTREILGCSFEELKSYFESKFEPWMTWENKGLYNGNINAGWDIDHIIPISLARNIEEMIELNNYKNLQPLCSYTNRHIKRNY